jgi:hypothetical protein
MFKKIHIVLFSFCCILLTSKSFAQADTLVNVCNKYMKLPFISDGQQYQTILNNDETAEFHAIFYGGSTYRIIGCSGLSEKNLLYTITDTEHNILYSNKDFENAPYWDFKFMNTMDCVIEARLKSKNGGSGFAIIMIGFRQ